MVSTGEDPQLLVERAVAAIEALPQYPEDPGVSEELERRIVDDLQAAAEAGSVMGQYHLGWFFWKIQENEDAARPWLERAAGQGHAAAATELGHICDFLGEEDEAHAWYRRAAERGDEDGAANLRDYERMRAE